MNPGHKDMLRLRRTATFVQETGVSIWVFDKKINKCCVLGRWALRPLATTHRPRRPKGTHPAWPPCAGSRRWRRCCDSRWRGPAGACRAGPRARSAPPCPSGTAPATHTQACYSIKLVFKGNKQIKTHRHGTASKWFSRDKNKSKHTGMAQHQHGFQGDIFCLFVSLLNV